MYTVDALKSKFKDILLNDVIFIVKKKLLKTNGYDKKY